MPGENYLKVASAREALTKDIDRVREANNIDAEYVISITGGPDIYSLVDLSDGGKIGTVMLRRSDYYPGADEKLYHGGDLQEKLEEMLMTPMEQLKRLVESDRLLYDDIRRLKADLGVLCYKPTAWSQEERIPDGERQILIATTEFSDGHCYISSEGIGVVFVNISEYIPGRHDYPDGTIYREGELRQEFSNDRELVSAYVERALNNARHLEPTISLERIDWVGKCQKIRTEFAEAFKAATKHAD